MRRAASWLSAGSASLLVVGFASLLLVSSASARTLEVGPQRELKNPSDAARIAAEGDRIVIDPGEYFDCAIWRANGITIEAAGSGDTAGEVARVILTDRACAGKASFVIGGNDVTLRGLAFTRIRVPDGNGAGIRAEGRNLTVERSAFTNNQTAILAADQPAGFLDIRDSAFTANGACSAGGCLGAVVTGRLARLRIERSRFRDPRASQPGDAPRAGAQIGTAAQSAELVDNRIEDGDGASSSLVAFASGGALLMSGNTLEKGPRTENSRGAILATGTGWGHADRLVFRHNTLVNQSGRPGVFLLNLTTADPEFDGNVIGPGDAAVSSSGVWRHRLRHALDLLIGVKDTARHAAGSLLRSLRSG